MADKSLYVLAGYDDRTERILAGMQEKLNGMGFSGIQTKNIPMHFTLGSYSTDREAELNARLTEIAETQEAFSVSFSHIGCSGCRRMTSCLLLRQSPGKCWR